MANDVAILNLLKGRMHWHQTRQKVLAENVANADTPRFKPHDLAPFEDAVRPDGRLTTASLGLARTNPGHLGGLDGAASPFGSERAASFETVPSGNSVNLEEQMTKVVGNQMDFQTVAALYQKSLGYLRTALGRR
jgi:flagellar basal-body rod protein FlgB